jgi:phosphatidate cytidylyltransferase
VANNIVVRTITGVLLVGIVLAAIFYGEYSFLALLGTVVFFGVLESEKITQKRIAPMSFIYATIALLMFVLRNINHVVDHYLLPNTEQWSYILLFCIPCIELLFAKKPSITKIGTNIAMIALLTIAFSSLLSIFMTPNGTTLVFAFFCIIWGYDTFAYLAGTFFGRHHICESISPKKSWEGAFGGLFFAVIISIILFYSTDILEIWQWILFAVIIAVFGTIGDFCESLLKRYFNIKDSSNILPGHGGILDRFDSAIFAAPFILLYLQIINHIVI